VVVDMSYSLKGFELYVCYSKSIKMMRGKFDTMS
jgi:hypothetical protein